MDEMIKKISDLEGFLFKCFAVMLASALIFVFFKLNKAGDFLLWGAMIAFILQKAVRLLNICFLMESKDCFVRLWLCGINLMLLGCACYIWYDLFMIYGKEAVFNFNLKKALYDLLELL